MRAEKNIFNLLFIFLSLSFRGHPGIVWSTIPGLSICGESPLTMRAQFGNNRFCPSPLGIASLCYLGATYCGDSPTTNACTAGL